MEAKASKGAIQTWQKIWMIPWRTLPTPDRPQNFFEPPLPKQILMSRADRPFKKGMFIFIYVDGSLF
jgi:hypothetical protein